MRNIQNRYKRIKHMDSFINTRHQRKLRKFLENPLSGSQVSGLGPHLYDPGSQIPSPTYELGAGSQVSSPTFWILGLRSQVPPMRWVPGLGSRVPPKALGLRSHFLDMPWTSAAHLASFCLLQKTFPREIFIMHKQKSMENLLFQSTWALAEVILLK